MPVHPVSFYPTRFTVFRENRSTIHTGILLNIHDIAHRAHSKHLISERVYRDATGTLNRLTADEKTERFLEELECRIKIDPCVLDNFVDVLRERDCVYHKTLIKAISELVLIHPYNYYAHA